MALINCSDCGKEISDSAAACIHCGRPMTAPQPSPDPTPATSSEQGNTRSRLKQDAGNAIGGIGFALGIVVMIFDTFWSGLATAFVLIAIGLAISYG